MSLLLFFFFFFNRKILCKKTRRIGIAHSTVGSTAVQSHGWTEEDSTHTRHWLEGTEHEDSLIAVVKGVAYSYIISQQCHTEGISLDSESLLRSRYNQSILGYMCVCVSIRLGTVFVGRDLRLSKPLPCPMQTKLVWIHIFKKELNSFFWWLKFQGGFPPKKGPDSRGDSENKFSQL